MAFRGFCIWTRHIYSCVWGKHENIHLHISVNWTTFIDIVAYFVLSNTCHSFHLMETTERTFVFLGTISLSSFNWGLSSEGKDITGDTRAHNFNPVITTERSSAPRHLNTQDHLSSASQTKRERERSQNAAEKKSVRLWMKCRKLTLSRKTQMPGTLAVSVCFDRWGFWDVSCSVCVSGKATHIRDHPSRRKD